MKVAIAGGGIGGPTPALMLHERGFDVHVHEAVSEMKPLGVGINLPPHASQELCQESWREPRGRAAGCDTPQYSIHRGALQITWLQVAQEWLGASRCALPGRLPGR